MLAGVCLRNFKKSIHKVTTVGATGNVNPGQRTVVDDSLVVIGVKRSATAGGTTYTVEMTEGTRRHPESR